MLRDNIVDYVNFHVMVIETEKELRLFMNTLDNTSLCELGTSHRLNINTSIFLLREELIKIYVKMMNSYDRKERLSLMGRDSLDSMINVKRERSKYLRKIREDAWNYWSITPILELDSNINIDCAICLNSKEGEEMIKLNCHHAFCRECLFSYLGSLKDIPVCALCRSSIYSLRINSGEFHGKIIKMFC